MTSHSNIHVHKDFQIHQVLELEKHFHVGFIEPVWKEGSPVMLYIDKEPELGERGGGGPNCD